MQPAVFFDRDGTLIEDRGYLGDPEQVVLLPEAAEAVRLAGTAGYAVVVITNQSGVARGLYTEADVAAVNQRLVDRLAVAAASVAAIYHCPHHPLVGDDAAYTRWCQCRKPRPGMLLRAAREHDLDLRRSAMIGDFVTDVQAGAAAGTTPFLVAPSGAPPTGWRGPHLGSALQAVRLFLEGAHR
jgi:D-glycero-D-manno-heptose 1,7-bisphosphate phosphatase